MKIYFDKLCSHYFIVFASMILTASCESNKKSEYPDYNSSASVSKSQIFVNQDSINQANAFAEAKRLELIKEAKERKVQDAKAFISAFSSELAKIVSPMTGRSPTYNIIDNESTYNELTETLSVVFESRWEAIPDFNPNSIYQVHIYKGKVTLYGNGEVRQELIAKNEVLETAIEANEGMAKFNDFLNKMNSNE